MPYRAELKRPDLKGQFPCSVCGKIFCHSSSLSRHRMQAHFKSYTCTQCNQEISSNETLRSHMFRVHNISRMFMCRCCNWAFPDKTSLHIHMQSMLRNGTPGEVAVLARSSTEDDPSKSLDDTPHGSPSYVAETLIKHQLLHPNSCGSNGSNNSNNNNTNTNHNGNNNTNNTTTTNNNNNNNYHNNGKHNINNNNISNNNNNINMKAANNKAGINSIFPTITKAESLLTRMKKEHLLSPADFTALSSNQWLSAWLANNPFAPNFGLNQQQPDISCSAAETALDMVQSTISEDADNEVLQIKIENDDDLHNEKINHNTSPASVIVDPCCLSVRKSDDARGSQKRKATRPQQVTDIMHMDVPSNGEPPCKLTAGNVKEVEHPSPTVSDSYNSGASSHAGDTLGKCFDCQVVKEKLNASQSKMLEYEEKINHLEAKIVQLQRNVRERNQLNNDDTSLTEGTVEQPQVVVPTMPAVALFPQFSPSLSFMHNPAVKIFFHNLIQSQLNRSSC